MSQILIPKGWKLKKLDEISEIKRGISWSKSQESRTQDKNSIPVLRIGNVRERHLDLSNILYIQDLKPEKIDKNKVSKEDILLVGSNGNRDFVGRSCKIDKKMDFVFASFLMAVSKITSEVEPNFLLYYLNSPQGWNFIRDSTSTGVGINNLKISKLRNMPIIFPINKELQKKIVQKLDYVLGQLEEKKKLVFELQKRNISLFEKLTKQKRGRVRQLSFIDYLADILVEKIVSKCELNFPNYVLKELEFLCKDIIDTPHSTVKYFDTGIPVIRTSDIQPYKIDFSSTKFTSQGIYLERKKKIDPQKDDILYTREAPWGLASEVSGEKFVVGQRILLLRPDIEKIRSDFFTLILNSSFGYNQAKKTVKTTTSEHVNIVDIKKFLIPLIPKIEQEKTIKIISEKLFNLDLVVQRLSQLISQQNKMMQDFENLHPTILNSAFTGKLIN